MPSYEVASMYIGLQDGAYLTVRNTSSSWIAGEGTIPYDPSERGWYQSAVEEDKLTFYMMRNG